MGWFQAFRQPDGFARYSSNRSAVTVDKDFIAVIYICVLVFLASILTAFGSRGKERWTTVIRVAYSVIVCSVILICLYGYGWQEGEVTAKTIYLFRSMEKMDATVGLRMSLVSANITLTGQYGNNTGNINYNERFLWLDSNIEYEFHRKLEQGLPAPLMTVAEYISIDVGGFRWGRYFREASYYSFILLWSSFAFWVVTIILMCSVVFFGSVMFIVSGLTMCVTVLVYHLLQPTYPLMIPFDKQVLRLHYSWCFWLLFTTGILTTVLGIIIVFLNYMKPKETATFFGLENEFPDGDDTGQVLTQTLDVKKVIDSSLPQGCYSNPCFRDSTDMELSKGKWASLPELNGDMSDTKIESQSISSVDRNHLHSRSVCVSIPDGVELYPDNEDFKLPIADPTQTQCEIVSSLEENKEAESSTKF